MLIAIGCLDEATLNELEYLTLLKVFQDIDLHIPMFAPAHPQLWDRTSGKKIAEVLK